MPGAKTAIIQTPGAAPELAEVLAVLAAVGAEVARVIQINGIDTDLSAERGVNSDGDGQKALDVIADEMFATALAATSVRYYASEEREEVVEINPQGKLALAIDPLDGSSNIAVNVSIGTIFSIFATNGEGDANFLRPAREQIAAGYIIYGPQCALVLSWGQGVTMYVLDPGTHTFRLVRQAISIAPESSEYAINSSNYRHWSAPIRAYIDDCVAGAEGPRGQNFNTRWIASLVAETHRILMRGGLFLYPGDSRHGYANGRLRHVYECAPIAFLIEEAGGGATDGMEPILGRTPDALHGRTPFVFGSINKVARVSTYFDMPPEETSALFGKRGLFRNQA